ncbi:MAG: transposase family protein [Tunicatimonas sp.]
MFADESRLRLDLGYLGYHPEGVITLLPIKKPYRGELTKQQKKFNQWVSKYRVVVEHAISGVKRCRIVKERCRNFAADFRDQIMLTCTALHGVPRTTSASAAHSEATASTSHAQARDTKN